MNMPKIRCGPELRPVSREDKVREWVPAIQAQLRHRDGGPIPADAAADYGDRFWKALQRRCVPLRDIMATDGTAAADWVLAAYGEGGLLVRAPATTNLEDP
jgi:hypothetical protein